MAQQHASFLKGKFANLILYEMNGRHYARTVPAKVRQSKGTKTASKKFGEASRISTALRAGLSQALPDRNKRNLRNRLISPLYGWVRSDKQPGKTINLPFITGFQFCEEATVAERLRTIPVIEWREDAIVVSFLLESAKDITAPVGTEKVYIQLAATSISTKDTSKGIRNHISEWIIDYPSTGELSRTINIPFGVTKNELAVIMLSLKYEVKANIIRNKRWLPSGIVGSCFVNDSI